MDYVLARFQIKDGGADARKTVLQFYRALLEELHPLQ